MRENTLMNEYFDIWKLIAGLGLFLFAMRLLEKSLRKLAGKRFRRFIRQSTDKPYSSVFSGIIATTIVQSSSLVGLIVLAFVGAGIIPLVNAIGIIIGSNLGTTFTGWIVTLLGFKLDFTLFIYPMIAVGGISYGLFKGKFKYFSLFIFGLALLLMGLGFMKDSVSSLTEAVDIEFIQGYPLIVYLLLGAIFTAIIQSSSATMMLTLSALYAGVISLPAAAALVIGADLGTTSTVFLGSLQGGAAKKQLAMAHGGFNFSVDILAFLLLFPLLAFIKWMAIVDPLFSLVAFHSLFNLLGLIIFIPFIKQFASKLQQWFPKNEQRIGRYLNSVPVEVAEAALEALTKEVRLLLLLVVHLNMRYLSTSPEQSKSSKLELQLPETIISLDKLEEYYAIKSLEGEIVNYALRVKSETREIVVDSNHDIEIDELAIKVDNLMNSARHAVYSAKSIKDIEQDLNSFALIDNRHFGVFFEELKIPSLAIDTKVGHLLNHRLEQWFSLDTNISEELLAMEESLHNTHHEMASRLYLEKEKLNLSSVEFSTLLNVDKELQTSSKSLIEALRDFIAFKIS